jgi:hypothetical protein
LTSKAFRFRKGLVGGCALLLVATLGVAALSSCAAPQFTYVADSSANTYFKVPYGWHQISSVALASALESIGESGSGAWSSAYDADSPPSANHFLTVDAPEPFVFAEVGQLSATASDALSYNGLEDSFLPVTSSARSTAQKDGFPLTDFKLLSEETVTPGQGVHGVQEIYDYTYPDGVAETFNQVALTNADQTTVYLLIVHCTSACYSQNQTDIDAVASSFTVRSP